jgi:hypothetical protein
MLSEKRHRNRLGADTGSLVAADQRILESNLTGECSRLCVRGAEVSRADLVAPDTIFSVTATARISFRWRFRFLAARIGRTAIPDSWSLIASGGCDLKAERVRGHMMVALLWSVPTWVWPLRPWSFFVDGPRIARTRRPLVGEADSSLVRVSREGAWLDGVRAECRGSRRPLSSTLGAIPAAVRAAAAGSGAVVARGFGGRPRVERSRVVG